MKGLVWRRLRGLSKSAGRFEVHCLAAATRLGISIVELDPAVTEEQSVACRHHTVTTLSTAYNTVQERVCSTARTAPHRTSGPGKAVRSAQYAVQCCQMDWSGRWRSIIAPLTQSLLSVVLLAALFSTTCCALLHCDVTSVFVSE